MTTELTKGGTFNLYSLPYWFMVERGKCGAWSISIKGNAYNFYFPYRTKPLEEPPYKPSNKIKKEDGLVMLFENVPSSAIYTDFWTTPGKQWVNQTNAIWDRVFIPADTIRVDCPLGLEANYLLTALIEIARVKSNQWWISKLPFLHLFAGPVQGEIIDEETHNIRVHSPTLSDIDFDEKLISVEMWIECLTDLEKGIYAPIYKSSLLDAVYDLAADSYVKCVLELIQTLETCFDINVGRKWKSLPAFNRASYERHTLIRGLTPKHNTTDTPQLLHLPIQKVTDRSFKIDQEDNFNRLNEFWNRKRHNVAHGIPLTSEQNRELYYDALAIRECVKWIEQVSA